MTTKALHTIPIADRPPHGTWWNTILFPLLFNAGILGINSAQFCALPLLLVPVVGRRWFEGVIDWTKDGFGRLFLFAPTSLHISTSAPPELAHLIERDTDGRLTKLNLPDRLVIMSNHQAYTDWMYMWILACYAGHARGITILLKWSLRSVPFVGWGMRFFRFIFMKRSWAADRDNLTRSLNRLGAHARASDERPATLPRQAPASASGEGQGEIDKSDEDDESIPLLTTQSGSRSPLWLLIFPEGTITSDEERAKSVKYATKEGIDDLTMCLHPRSTGLLFCLRTLLPQVPDLQLLDVTIGYAGVPLGKYPQDYYGLGSIFFRGIPPPSVHIHLSLHTDLSSLPEKSGIPSLLPTRQNPLDEKGQVPLASPEEARSFELWLRERWIEKEERLLDFARDGKFRFKEEEQEGGVEIVQIRQVKWYHWIASMGGGGLGTVTVLAFAIWGIVAAVQR